MLFYVVQTTFGDYGHFAVDPDIFGMYCADCMLISIESPGLLIITSYKSAIWCGSSILSVG